MSAPAAVDVTSTYYSFPFLTQASDTLTARVFGQGTVAPTGQVQLTVGGNPFKTAQLVAGKPMIGLDMKALSGPRDLQTLPHLGSGDFNNDGLTDLVAASNNALSIYLSNGDGSFNLLPLVSTPYYNYSLATADFNADGWTDIIAATGIFGRYTILLGHGDGTFEVKQNLLARTQSDVSFRFADFNGDGILDVRADSTYFIGNGDGTFADTAEGTRFADRSPVLPSATSNTAIADFNRDGINDTVSVSSEDRYTVSLCGMDGNCTDTTHPSNVGTVGLVSSADMNGDGIADIVIGHLKGDFPVSVTFQVLFGRGDGTFTDGPVRIFKAHVRALLMGDFNNDGVADLGTLGEQAIRGGATLLFGLGDGTFLPDEAFLITGNFTPVPGRFLTNGLPTFANERQYGEVVVVVSSLSYVSTATFQGALAESGRSVRAHYGGDHVYLSADSDSLLLK